MSTLPVVDIFWTGGWDSSYRVLDLALVHKVSVQPHYIVDVDRISSLHEFRAMRKMREMIAARDPEAAARIRDLKIVAINDIAPNPEITEKYGALRKLHRLGGQYEFLKRYALQESIVELEVGWVLPPTRASFATKDVFLEHLEWKEMGRGFGTWVLAGVDELHPLSFLNGFTFPLLKMTKRDIGTSAESDGFADILNLSWFCHSPIGKRPCGYCAPCVQTINDGLGYRVPLAGRLRYPFRRVLFPLRTLREQPELVRRRWRAWVRERVPTVGR